MTCQEALDYLYDMIDSEVSGLDEKRIRDHLDKCRDCFDVFEVEKKVNELIKERLSSDPPSERLAECKANLLAELDAVDAKISDGAGLLIFRRPVYAVAAVASLIVMIGAALVTSELVQHYRTYGPLERAYYAAAHRKPIVGELAGLSSVKQNVQRQMGFSVPDAVDGYSLVDGFMDSVSGVEMAHLVYASNGSRVSVLVVPSDQIEIPEDLRDSGIVNDEMEFFDHNCRGCRLVYYKLESVTVITATNDREIELMGFVPGYSAI